MSATISDARKAANELEKNILAALRALEDVYDVRVQDVTFDRCARTVLRPDGEIFSVRIGLSL